LPINKAVASGKGNMFFFTKAACSNGKKKIAIDRHSPRLIPNQFHFSDPPNFSLPSTFKAALLVYLGNGVKEMKYKASYKGLLFPQFLRLYKGSKNFIL
jgi:hypothetical protein